MRKLDRPASSRNSRAASPLVAALPRWRKRRRSPAFRPESIRALPRALAKASAPFFRVAGASSETANGTDAVRAVLGLRAILVASDCGAAAADLNVERHGLDRKPARVR